MLAAHLSKSEVSLVELASQVDQQLQFIKEQTESLEYRGGIDEHFQYKIGSLCVYIAQFKHCVDEHEAAIDRFIENSLDKFKHYAEFYLDIQRLLALFVYQTKGMEPLNRPPKIEQASNFNVIKINTHTIDIQCKNEALVSPTQAKEKERQQLQTVLQLLESKGDRETILTKATDIVERFESMQDKMRIYQSHYIELGNHGKLESERLILDKRLEEIECSHFNKEIQRIKDLFDQMLAILRLECDHCQDYVNNTMSRFIECFTLYEKLLEQLALYQLQPDSLKKDEIPMEQKRKCASMY